MRRRIHLALTAGVAFGALATLSLAAGRGRSAAHATPGAWHFVTAPNLRPPRLQVLSRKRGAISHGYFLGDNLPNLGNLTRLYGKPSLVLLDSALRPVWVQGVGPDGAGDDLQQETYRGAPVLVWWHGGLTPTGTSQRLPMISVVDEHYRRVANLQAKAPWLIDGHDDWIEGSHIWFVVARYVQGQDLTPYGGPSNGTIYDCGLEEYDLSTGKLLYTWDALNPGGQPNVPLSESEVPPPPPNAGHGKFWDPYHLNSLQVLPHHRLLISMRNTWGIYLIDTATSKTVWTLGGKASTFSQGRHAHFAWQHDARLVTHGPEEEMTLFNDDCCQQNTQGASGQSRGMILRLDTRTHASTLVAAYRHNPPLIEGGSGSMQLLSRGNVLIDWSDYLSEYSRSGKQLLDARWPGMNHSYRATYTDTWVGTPYYPPTGAVRQVHGHTVVYASWNGATQMVSWAVLAGSSKGALSRVGTHARTGFETHMTLSRRYHVYEVQALGARGRVLRTSPPFPG